MHTSYIITPCNIIKSHTMFIVPHGRSVFYCDTTVVLHFCSHCHCVIVAIVKMKPCTFLLELTGAHLGVQLYCTLVYTCILHFSV